MNIDYETWLKQVNWEIEKICGLSMDDIDDYHYADNYDDGISSRSTARKAVKNAGGYI